MVDSLPRLPIERSLARTLASSGSDVARALGAITCAFMRSISTAFACDGLLLSLNAVDTLSKERIIRAVNAAPLLLVGPAMAVHAISACEELLNPWPAANAGQAHEVRDRLGVQALIGHLDSYQDVERARLATVQTKTSDSIAGGVRIVTGRDGRLSNPHSLKTLLVR